LLETNKSEDIELDKYKDILYLNRPKSRYPKLSLESRAAQFSPFSALTGYKEMLNEIERITEDKKELTEEEKCIINSKLSQLDNNSYVKITYFLSDKKKIGGHYKELEGYFKKIDSYNKEIILQNNCHILIDNILNIEIKNCYD